jgi:serine/threonine protein kinase
MKGGGLIFQGGYGCIFRPYIDCKGKQTHELQYVSKIQIKTFAAMNEIKIGKEISKIPYYYNFFVPAIDHCDINIKEFKARGIKDCDAIRQKGKFVLLKMHFVGYKRTAISYSNYISHYADKREILMNLIDGYQYLLESLRLLKDHQICHFDLNPNNILFSEVKTIPIIIDFGLSIPIASVDKRMEDYFYRYAPRYYYWPLEVHYINLLLNVGTPTSAHIKELCKDFIEGNDPLQKCFSSSFLQSYENSCISILENYKLEGFTASDILDNYWKTWDNYALSIMYINIIYLLNISHKGEYPLFTENKFIGNFSQLLLQNVHPNPEKRFTIEKSIEQFKQFFMDPDVNTIENYEKLLTNLEEASVQIKKIVKAQDKKRSLLIKKTYRQYQTLS